MEVKSGGERKRRKKEWGKEKEEKRNGGERKRRKKEWRWKKKKKKGMEVKEKEEWR